MQTIPRCLAWQPPSSTLPPPAVTQCCVSGPRAQHNQPCPDPAAQTRHPVSIPLHTRPEQRPTQDETSFVSHSQLLVKMSTTRTERYFVHLLIHLNGYSYEINIVQSHSATRYLGLLTWQRYMCFIPRVSAIRKLWVVQALKWVSICYQPLNALPQLCRHFHIILYDILNCKQFMQNVMH